MNERINYLKAIGILLMVIGHSDCSIPHVTQVIYMFHMPLFYIAAGYCYKETYTSSPLLFVRKRIVGLWQPFVKYGLLFLILHNVLFRLNIYNDIWGYRENVSHMYDIEEFFVRLYRVIKMDHYEQLLGGYWFLKALFYGSLIFYFTKYLCAKLGYLSRSVNIVCTLFLLFAAILMNEAGVVLPVLHIDATCFYAASFVFSGYVLKVFNVRQFNVLEILSAFSLLVIGSFAYQIDTTFQNYNFYKIFPFTITAIIATWAFYSIPFEKFWVVVTDFLTFVGNNTLAILTWHFLSFKVVSLVIISIYHIPITQLAEFPVISSYAKNGWWIVYVIVSILICCVIAKLDHYLANWWNAVRKNYGMSARDGKS